MIPKIIRTAIVGFGLLISALLFEGYTGGSLVVSQAEAIVGRPATPISVAGAARRTTRRTVRRTTAYVAALPRGCTRTVVISGHRLFHCGGVYYQPHGGRYVVVTVH